MALIAIDSGHVKAWTATEDTESADRRRFRLRIVNVDHYLAKPSDGFDDLYSIFRCSETRRVPVIRVFGVTDNGVKTCLHVHRVYPYLSIQYNSADNENNHEFNKQQFMSRLVREVEARLLPTRVRTRNTTNESTEQIIYDIQEVDAIPFYGYHDNYQKFLRIYFYNPFNVQKVSDLLLSGEIMGRQIQTFEAHIPYTLQFLIDNNLYGMNFLEAERVEFRRTDALPEGILYSDIEPMSSCQLECDIDCKDIVNRNVSLNEGRLPGLEAIWAEELKRCHDSQEVLKLKGIASQDRTDIPSNQTEEQHMKRLFEGLKKLNIKLDSNTDNYQEMDTSLNNNIDAISQTIEDVINNSQSFSINQTIEDVIISSQNNTISQTIEDVITESQKQKNHSNAKHKNRRGHTSSRKRLNFKNVLNDGPSHRNDNMSQLSPELEDSLSNGPTALFADASTQTEVMNSFNDSIDSVFGDDIGDIICDCDSDECCDQCCDQNSDQCECDCERCEFEKCKRIPQMDGAFDSDDSDRDRDFTPKYKDDSDDSDFDGGSKKKKKGTPKKGAKRGRNARSTPSKKSKTSVAVASDSEEESYRSSPKRRPTARGRARKSPSPLTDEDIFESSSGRKVKPSKNLSDKLWDKFKPKDSKKGQKDGSPIHMSFSESDGSDKETNFMSSFKGLTSPAKSDRSRERSATPYLDEEPEEEKPPKTRPGPRSSKSAAASRPGPKSSKPGPMSSKLDLSSRPGPKSSKSRPEPKSKIRDSLSSDEDIEIISHTSSPVRRGRATAGSTSSLSKLDFGDIFSPKKATIPKGKGKRTGSRGKSEVELATESLSEYITPNSDPFESPKRRSYNAVDYLATADLIWKSFNSELVQIDANFYDMAILNNIGNEGLDVVKSPEYLIDEYKKVYLQNIDYWEDIKAEVEQELKGGRKGNAPTRSKGALKDFYTLPHLNEKRSSERAQRSPSKTNKSAERQQKAKPVPKTKANASKRVSNEIARLMNDASDIVGKSLGKRQPKKVSKMTSKATKSKAADPKPSPSKRGSSTAKSKASDRSTSRQPSRSRLPRGVTTSTVFNAINIPFYDSDIRSVTELTGHRKVSHLKALCEEFELDIQKLPKHYERNYRRRKPDLSVLRDKIYYNDYSGILPDEQSRDTQDVLITMRNLINDVVSVSHCIDSVVVGVTNDMEPKPVIFADEEEYEEPEYEDNENEEDVAPESGITENGVEFDYEGIGGHEKRDIEEADDPLTKALLQTFGNNEDENNGIEDKQINGTNAETEEQNDIEDMNSNKDEKEDQNDGQQSDDTEDEEKEEHEDKNGYNSDHNNEETREESYDETSHQYSPTDQNNKHLSSDLNPTDYQPMRYHEDEEEEEEDDEGEGEEDEQSDDNLIVPPSNHMINPSVDPAFKLQSDCMYSGFVETPIQSQPQNISYVQNPLQNPIVPTLMPHQQVSLPSHPYPSHPQWQQPLQPQYSSMPTIGIPPAQQSDNEFDYNYMFQQYHNNSNIPQFDGIFDDDDIQTVGKPFNMRCSSDETIERLSQGSRSEEAAPKRHAADIVEEALLSDQSSHSGHRPSAQTTSGSASASTSTRAVSADERYGYSISGVVVKINKSLPDRCLQQLGRELVSVERLDSRAHSEELFSVEDRNSFVKTCLEGEDKFNYLQSLCNKKIKICLNRLNLNDINLQNISNVSLNSISSDFNKKLISSNTKSLCVESNASSSDRIPDEIPESPLNETSIIDEVPESPINEQTSQCSDTSNGIYSFYLDESLSEHMDSQSTQQSTQKSDHSSNSQPNTPSMHTRAQHSTPMNSNKFKPFSQTLSSAQKAINLSSGSPNSSNMFNLSEPILFDQPIAGTSRQPNQYYYRNDSLIEGPTQSATNNFELSSVGPTASPVETDYEYQYLTTMSVEIHVSTRAKLNPDPKTDAIEIIFYSIHIDRPPDPSQPHKYINGMIAVDPLIDTFDYSASFNVIQHKQLRQCRRAVAAPKGVKVDYTDDEVVLLMKFVEIVKQYDPEIIVGYKIDTLSWGYILERARVLNMAILTPLSRINDDNYCYNFMGAQNGRECQLSGRITLNVWNVLRKEVTLNQYSYENCHFHVLHERIPSFGFETLTKLYSNRLNHYDRRRVVDYYLQRTIGSLRMLDKLDYIGRTCELARLFGIQFDEVFNRGTQFRVESIMLRHCRPLDYMPISPSRGQVAGQRAPEILPLILEPESNYYRSPVVVLDFQSLYPSMMIAYNYCYSTCLGKVDQLIRENPFVDLGCFSIEMNKQLLLKHRNDIHISPNGVVFLKSNVRKGILSKMLEEILETRVMVKTAMKTNNKKEVPNKALNRKLDARQLGLKLISNVTYGYTSASFSGRMPCVDIADAIVSKGRETLERAINLVNSRSDEWGGKVIYGDTDSLFIHFPDLTKEEAFIRGQMIAEVITAENPKPVRLKFEKVYQPCVLETKKRYVGLMWESPEQQDGVFDAKGIETVRRDTCPAVAKMLEKSLRILFKTNDVKNVKEYLSRQFQKILNGRISLIEDFVFARQYRGVDNYSERSRVPSAEIAKRRVAADPMSEPKIKERVPYVVIAGAPNEPVFKLVKEPLDLVKDPSLRLNSQYYIERVIIPALNRVFEMMGQNVNHWYREMPKKVRINRYQYLLGKKSKPNERKTITHYFNSTECCVCENNSKGKDFCDNCRPHKNQCAAAVADQIRDIHLKYSQVLNACKKCSASRGPDIECLSIECPNLFRLHQSRLDLMNAKYLSDIMDKHF